MANGFGLYDMYGNVSEWLWDSYYSQVTATTEYKDDNYKGPDLGLGDNRFLAGDRFNSPWDSQYYASPASVLGNLSYASGSYYGGNRGFRTLRGL
jgi:formylglycine-generating enzyme required for sulfatase activity